MKRRNFITSLGLGSLAMPFLATVPSMASNTLEIPSQNILPKALAPGDTIGIVSPSGAIFESEPYEIAIESMQAMGLKVKLGEFVKSRHGHLAGTDKERAAELNAMFSDPQVDGIICLRGGSGAARLLDKIDYNAIARSPKAFIGYSDITALHLAIYAKTGLVTFHGPIAVSSWNPFAVRHFKELLFNKSAMVYQNPTDKAGLLAQTKNRVRTITSGTAKGELLGGNLAVMTGIMGSPYFPSNWKGKILYLEDVGEPIYAMDRMMSQLQLGGVLDQISGFVFGKCTNCTPGSGYGSLTLEEVLDHFIKPLGIPAYSGAMIGHIDKNATVPNGIQASLNADHGTISLLSPAVN